jgi:PAS domain S-box-containing protein
MSVFANMPENTDPTILCADDTEAQRYAVAHVLRAAGFNVLEACTGGQALEMVSRQPDIVVLDVNLPDISGFEVCKQIKSNELTARTPVLHISATQITTQARVAGLDGGADAYLVQPVAPEELVATVRALLRVRKAEDALWQSQQQYRLFFETNPLACWVFDTEDFKILAVNAAAVNQYGYSREESMNMTLQDISVAEEWFTLSEMLGSDVLPSGPNRIWKHRIKGGGQIDVEMIWAPLRVNDRDAKLVIVQDITEKLKHQAAERQEEMRRLLLGRVLQAQEEERRRIARELHDEAGQMMTSLLVGLRSLSDARRLVDAKDQAQRLRHIASEAIAELGRLARGLHSSVLDDLGLEAALRRYAEEVSATHRIRIDLEFCELSSSLLTKEEQINLFRIIQEALTNVARHSQAECVRIRFGVSASELLISIRDNGRGFDEQRAARNHSRHLGIEGMRQRAAMLGGTLQVTSEPARGVSIELRVPVQNISQESHIAGIAE